jgi:hypothetical protein
MIILDEKIKNKIIEAAKISAKKFIYYRCKEPNAGNYYVGEDKIEGQCSDYALDFVIRWNKENPENKAGIVAINQDCGIKPGSYKLVRKIDLSDFDKQQIRSKSGWLKNVSLNGKYIDRVLYHPCLGFYEVEQTEEYEVKTHFGVNMSEYGRPHVWAKIGDIAIDPCWADTDNTDFIGEDIV